MSDWHLLRSVWYPYFKPNKDAVSEFTVHAWRIVTTSSGAEEGKPIFLRQVADSKKHYSVSHKELGKKFCPEKNYIRVLHAHGFVLKEQGKHCLTFKSCKPA